MAKRVITSLVDDIDGTDASESLAFSFDGVAYEIDLSEKNATAFRKAVEKYVNSATRVGGRKATKPSGGGRSSDSAAVRQWAKDNGHEVTERGRIPQNVRDAYDAAMAGKAA